MNKIDETIMVMHIFDKTRQDICKGEEISQEVADLSNTLGSRNIYHMVLHNEQYGDHICLIDDFASSCYRDKNLPMWHYLVCEYDVENDKIIEHNDYVVNDSNSKATILDFILAWLRTIEDVREEEGECI